MHQETKRTGIKGNVRRTVIDRDGGCCILCGSPWRLELAHFISRAQGGMGIEQNLVCLCKNCHMDYDGVKREEYGEMIRDYLNRCYPHFTDKKRTYNKYEWLEDGRDQRTEFHDDGSTDCNKHPEEVRKSKLGGRERVQSEKSAGGSETSE